MSILELAIYVAAEAHSEQKDKVGGSYILHPIRVMMAMETDTERMAAVLHDVLEDTDFGEEDVAFYGFSEEVMDAIKCLTRSEDETYMDYIKRVNLNPIARKVKIADLEDNMDLKRIKNPTEKDFKRLESYRYYWELLKENSPEAVAEKLPSTEKKRTYSIYVDDNFHYMDEDERYLVGTYDDCETAIADCKRRVNSFLYSHYEPGKTAEALYDDYTSFGKDPFIVSSESPQDCNFSAWTYAKERAKEIVAAKEKMES